MTALEKSLEGAAPAVRAVLDRCLEGGELSVEEGAPLCDAQGADLAALTAAADHLRREQVGDDVTYVVNRNINFTNVCVKSCHFCAFSRKHRSEQAYFLDEAEIVRRAEQAAEWGATEVCLQAGLAPGLDGRAYIDLCRAVKRALPDMHVHAFSPEEVKYGAARSGVGVRDYLAELKHAGLGSLPGTSAEVLDDVVRDRIAPGRITTREWVDVVRTAHELGIPTTSTLMFGHVETGAQRLRHLDLLRRLQRETRGITELVPLSFVHEEAPMFVDRLVPGLRSGPTDDDVTRLFSISRLMLGADIPNIQVSWVKQGLERAQQLLDCGANDLGGTLMNESISTTAGARHGQLMRPSTLREAIRRAGRNPVERTTLYGTVRRFAQEPSPDEADPLDRIADADRVFGTYDTLASSGAFRFEYRHPRSLRRSG